MWYCSQQRRLRCPQNLMWTNCQPRIRSSKPHRSFWDRNTRETVKPPIGLRKSNAYFQLSFSMDSIISFHDLSNETKTFLQSMFNHCSINVLFMKQWCSLLSNVLLAFWLSAFFLASKTAVTLIGGADIEAAHVIQSYCTFSLGIHLYRTFFIRK